MHVKGYGVKRSTVDHIYIIFTGGDKRKMQHQARIALIICVLAAVFLLPTTALIRPHLFRGSASSHGSTRGTSFRLSAGVKTTPKTTLKNNAANQQNANKGTSGTNAAYDAAQGNRGTQLNSKQASEKVAQLTLEQASEKVAQLTLELQQVKVNMEKELNKLRSKAGNDAAQGSKQASSEKVAQLTLELQQVKADAAASKVNMEKELNKLRSKLGNDVNSLAEEHMFKVLWSIDGMAAKLARARSAECFVESQTFSFLELGASNRNYVLNLHVKMKGTELSVYVYNVGMSNDFPLEDASIYLYGTDITNTVTKSFNRL